MAFRISRRGSVPNCIIEPSRAHVLASLLQSKHSVPEDIYSNFMGTIKLIGFKEETKEEMRERPQSKEEREALEQRELALYKRLHEKYGNKDA